MTNCSTVALIRVNAHPPPIAPTTAPGTYQRTNCQSMLRQNKERRVMLAIRLASAATGATALAPTT